MTRMKGYYQQPTSAAGWIAFVCEDDIWVVSTAASVPSSSGPAAVARRVTSGGGDHGGRYSAPLFSPSGRLLAYTNSHSGAHELSVVPFDLRHGIVTGAPVQLTLSSAPAVLEPCRAVAWKRSEREIIFSATARENGTYTWDGTTLYSVQIPPSILGGEGKGKHQEWHAVSLDAIQHVPTAATMPSSTT